jgi:hypothetical protein
MISIGIDFQLVNASEALEGNILVARADDEEQHDPHRDRDYDDRDEDRERDHDRDDDEDWEHNKERDDEEDHHEERDHEEDRGDEDWDDADERRETEEMERREREEMEEDLDRFIPEAMQHLKKINPGLYDHIMENEEEFKPHFQDAVIHFTRMWRELDRHEEPGLEFELESFSSRFYVDILAHEFHMSKDESTRNVIRKDIHKILVDLFDIEIARREFRIQQLQMELNELKDEVRKAKATKDDQVEVYLEKVTSTSERTIFER